MIDEAIRIEAASWVLFLNWRQIAIAGKTWDQLPPLSTQLRGWRGGIAPDEFREAPETSSGRNNSSV